MSQMRKSILPGLLNTARSNEQRHHSRIRLFEIGHVFRADAQSDTGAAEISRLALLTGGEENATFWAGHGRSTDFFDLKGELDEIFDRIGMSSRIEYRAEAGIEALHPGQAAQIMLDGRAIGCIGTLHPQTQKHFDLKQSYVVAEINLPPLLQRSIPEFRNLSRFPETTRDLALVVENGVPASDIFSEIEDNTGNLLKKCELFDSYSGENIPSGFKSLAFNLTFQSESESLDSERIDRLIDRLLQRLNEKLGATLRS